MHQHHHNGHHGGGCKIRGFHMFIACLTVLWLFLINQIGTIQVLDHVMVFGDRMKETVSEAKSEQIQVFTAVGHSTCKYAALANEILEKLKREEPEQVFVYTWTAPSKEQFKKWLQSRKESGQVPMAHSTSPVIFNRMQQQRVFLGGVDELLDFIRQRFPSVDFSEELIRKQEIDELSRGAALEKSISKTEKRTNRPRPKPSNDETIVSSTATTTEKRNDDPVVTSSVSKASQLANVDASLLPRNPNSEESTFTPPPGNFLPKTEPPTPPVPVYYLDPLNRLEPQTVLRKNKIFTTYRLAENKIVTNYKPMMLGLKKLGWSYMQAAPLLAGFVLVQDQTSAAHVMKKYRKPIINNIGHGGQSCFGGTKGTQLRCRAEFAESNGCNYDSLGIQPPQYRLWIQEECERFFDVACKNEPNRMWMEKPSGGQHGAGMSVREGCEPIRTGHPSCAAEATKKKYIIMPYITPALINGHKFDLRSFLLVASLDPQLAFYHDGFIRKANSAYTSDLSDRNAHITNAVTQKTEDHYYSFSRLQEILHRDAGFPEDYMSRVFRAHAIKVQNYIFQVSRQFFSRRRAVYQIFALDWIIDSDGGIHMLEANSNPLVSIFKDMQDEMTESWDAMTELVVMIHTNPTALFTKEHPRLTAKEDERYIFKGWHLIFNELEERESGTPYKPCQVKIEQFSVSGRKPSGQKVPERIPTNEVREEKPPLRAEEAPEIPVPAVEQTTPNEVSTNDLDTAIAEKSASSDSDHDIAAKPGSTQLSETPYTVTPEDIKNAIKSGSQRSCVNLDPFSVFEDCQFVDRGLGPKDRTIRCKFTTDGYLYIIEPSDEKAIAARPPMSERRSPGCFPIVMITSGVHGNEQAGIVAGRHMRKTWYLRKARLVIVERLNPRADEKKARYIPRVPKTEQDLNRNFPSSGLVGDVAKDIWKMVEKLKPHVFVDMHEGWGFYNKLRANYQKGASLVGNPKFSKGSSVISSPEAQPIAKYMINRVNELTVNDHSKDFLSVVPPIETGLANMVMREFKSLVFVIETTSGSQPLWFRAKQQLIVVSTGLIVLGLLPMTFDGRQGFDNSMGCVAGFANCKLQHPDDSIITLTQSLSIDSQVLHSEQSLSIDSPVSNSEVVGDQITDRIDVDVGDVSEPKPIGDNIEGEHDSIDKTEEEFSGREPEPDPIVPEEFEGDDESDERPNEQVENDGTSEEAPTEEEEFDDSLELEEDFN